MKKINDIWDSFSFVMRAKNRKIILKSLITPQTPTSIREITRLNIKIISRALKELCKEDLVSCKTPKLKLGKVYVLTRKGERVIEMFKK